MQADSTFLNGHTMVITDLDIRRDADSATDKCC